MALAILLSSASFALADDVVYLTSPSNPRARTKVSGQIIDYTGKELVLRTDAGAERRFPGEQVADVETAYSPEQLAGDTLLAKYDYAPALNQYQLAIKKDQRRWVRRKIIADMIWCYRGLDQLGRAGELFLILVRDDPATPHYDCIPLNWLPREPPPDVEQKAREWLAREDLAEAALLAGSHLLPTARRGEALVGLEKLTSSRDPRVAALAQALAQSATIAAADDRQTADFADRVERFPSTLRAGPFFVLGRSLAGRNHFEEAALAFLRVPIQFPRERVLAAAALWEAGRALEQADETGDAARLYRELATNYAQSRYAAEATARLQALNVKGEPVAPASLAPLDAGSDDERFLDGLRQWRLFALAEKFCRDRLQRSDLDEARRVELTIELSRSLVEHAMESPPAESAGLWRAALAATDDFIRQWPDNPRLVQVLVQRGLVLLARGQLAREEAEVMADRAARLDAARNDLRQAIDQLKRAAADIGDRLRRTQLKGKSGPADYTPAELLSLQRNVNFQLARALRNQGESYPADSADRSAALVQAAELLGPLAQSEPSDPLAWPARMDEITCYRLLRDEPAATRRLDLLERLKPPPRVQLAARAQRVRLALSGRRLNEALAVLDSGREEAGQSSPDLDLAFLETYLQAWQSAADAKRTEAATQFQSQAAAAVQQIDRDYGGYWARRAESLLATRVAGSTDTGDLAVLARAAEGFYRAGQLDDALSAYDRARDAAASAHRGDQAFGLGYTAAAIEQTRKHFAAAAQRFHALALADPRHNKSADAHLLAIYNTTQARDAHSKPDGQQAGEYVRLLREHLTLWPQGPTADQARLWLARERQLEKKWTEAIELYQEISVQSQQAEEAVAAVAACYAALIGQMRAEGKPTKDTALAAAHYFERVITSGSGQFPARFSAVERQAALEAAKTWLEIGGDGFARAEKLLSAALAAPDNAPDAWTVSARGLLAYALAAAGRSDEAQGVLEQLKSGSPNELMSLVEGLASLAESAAPDVRRNLAALAQRAADLLVQQNDRLDEPQRQTLALLRAQATASLGQTDKALTELDRLARESPRDGRIQEEYARVLFHAGRDDALPKWREVEQKSRRGSERWFRAKYYQALVHERQGDKKSAARLVKLVQAQYPELGGVELRPKFLELLARCQR